MIVPSFSDLFPQPSWDLECYLGPFDVRNTYIDDTPRHNCIFLGAPWTFHQVWTQYFFPSMKALDVTSTVVWKGCFGNKFPIFRVVRLHGYFQSSVFYGCPVMHFGWVGVFTGLRGGRDHIDLGRRRLGKVTVLHVFFGSFGCGCVCYTTEIYVGYCWGTVYEQRCTGGGIVRRWVGG